MNNTKDILVAKSAITGYWVLLHRMIGRDPVMSKIEDDYVLVLGGRIIGFSGSPYFTVRRNIIYDTIIFGNNKVLTMIRVRDIRAF